MNVWKSEDWKSYYASHKTRSGIRMNYDRGIDEDLKLAIQRLVSWLRREFVFPIRLHVYVKNDLLVEAMDGDMVYSVFLWSDSKLEEPYIKIAVADYPELLEDIGRDRAMGTIMMDLLKQFTHYFQWLNDADLKLNDEGLRRQGYLLARRVLNKYADMVKHP